VKFASAALLTLSVCAQTPTPAKLPNFAGAGAMWSNPGWTGAAVLAVPVLTNAQLYSFTLYQEGFAKGKLTTTTSTGLDEVLKTFRVGGGTMMVHGIVTFGVTTSSTATTGSFPYGGGVTWAAKGWAPGVFVIKNAAKPSLMVVVGRYW
jgi:hypothetical protein